MIDWLRHDNDTLHLDYFGNAFKFYSWYSLWIVYGFNSEQTTRVHTTSPQRQVQISIMTYDVRRKVAKQWSMTMVEEEADVWHAMLKAGYQFATFMDDPTPSDFQQFTTTEDLYAAYKTYRRLAMSDSDEDLTPQQFGVAFNAVTEETLTRSKRWVDNNGRVRKWGYLGVRGPKSQRINLYPGRPPVK